VGEGTTFRIFPAGSRRGDGHGEPIQAGGLANAPKGSEVILLVEDEHVVRVLARRILKPAGTWFMKPATGARSGVCAKRMQARSISFCPTSVMPNWAGASLAEGVRTATRIKVMFMSGPRQDVVLRKGPEGNGVFALKPIYADWTGAKSA